MESETERNKEDKHSNLNTFITEIERLKEKPTEDYITESRLLLSPESKKMHKFEGDKEYFLPWVKFLNLAYVKLSISKNETEEEAFKKGIKEIITKVLLKGQGLKSIDWRIARKILSVNDKSLNYRFSLDIPDQKQIEEDILKSLKGEIDIALEHLLWQNESLFVNCAKATLTSLGIFFESSMDQCQRQRRKDLVEAVLCGRFDKEKFDLNNSLILGEDGGLYLLLNCMNQQQQDALVNEQIVTRKYLEDKIKAKDTGKGDKVILGAGQFGTVRLAL
ncbi:MAG: hypothetical protein ACQUHE_13655, partial [Bacteroidia bacterium]